MKPIIPFPGGEDLLELGKRCNAVYVCPKGMVGGQFIRKGPLVAYAGKDDQGRNLVGDIYFNFRRIEEHLKVVEEFASVVWQKIHKRGLACAFDTVCGIPQGGRTFGQELARLAGKRFVYADKKPKPTQEGKKQEYTWDLSQFEFEQGERVALTEDVYNNFQNTNNTLAEIAVTGARVVLLVGALNRSPVYRDFYAPRSDLGLSIPLVASINEAYPEYKQDDPEVVADISAGRLELEVKKNWARLCAIMEN
jgi:orotate phosphoribosyltransferase